MNLQDATKQEKKKKVKSIDLPFDAQTHGHSADELTHYLQEEVRMVDNDFKEKERVDARNALEEYVYDMREKLQVSPNQPFYFSIFTYIKVLSKCIENEDIFFQFNFIPKRKEYC